MEVSGEFHAQATLPQGIELTHQVQDWVRPTANLTSDDGKYVLSLPGIESGLYSP